MKVLLIRNNEISIEFIEEHLARNGTAGEVIVAMPEDLALEIAGRIDFDLVVCGVEGYLKNIIEDFLLRVKRICKGSYSIAVLRRGTLKEMGPVFFDNIDDFITCPVDSDEFTLRLMKAIANAKARKTSVMTASGSGRMHDVSSPETKLFDDDLQDVSIREFFYEEEVSESESEDPCKQENAGGLITGEDSEHFTFDELSYDELLRRRELMLEREAEARALDEEVMTDAISPEPEAMAVNSEQEPFSDELSYDELLRRRELMLEREAEARVIDEEAISDDDSTEPEAMAVNSEQEPFSDELSYDELLRRRELMLEREAEAKALDEEVMTDAISPEPEAMAVNTEPELNIDELSYDELLRRRELMLEREAEARVIDDEAMTDAVSPEPEAMAVNSEPELISDELSYDELLRRRELMLEREAEARELDEESVRDTVYPEPEAMAAETEGAEQIDDEPFSQSELMPERKAESRFEDEELMVPSIPDNDLMPAGEYGIQQVIHELEAELPREPKPEVRSVKEEKLQEEIDLLKHLRKDYGAKTSKVEKLGLKKEKKQKKAEAQKEKASSKSGRGIFTLIARVMAFMLVILAGATVYFYAASNIGDGIPAIAGYKLTAVRTAAMEPTLKLGDLVISVDVSFEEIGENDIITFKAGDDQGSIECQRVVRVEVSPEGSMVLITQGDGMASEDEVPVGQDMIVGKVTRYIPFAGFIVNVDTLRFALASVK